MTLLARNTVKRRGKVRKCVHLVNWLLILMRHFHAPKFVERRVAFALESAFFAGRAWSSWYTRNAPGLCFLQAFCQALKGHLAIGVLRSSLSGCDDYTTGMMRQTHACFDFIAVLSSGSARDKKLDRAITFEGWAIDRIIIHGSDLSVRTIPRVSDLRGENNNGNFSCRAGLIADKLFILFADNFPEALALFSLGLGGRDRNDLCSDLDTGLRVTLEIEPPGGMFRGPPCGGDNNKMLSIPEVEEGGIAFDPAFAACGGEDKLELSSP